MRKSLIFLGSLVAFTIFSSCKNNTEKKVFNISVTNSLSFLRKEVVAIDTENILELLESTKKEHIKIKKQGTEEFLLTQWIDNNQDGVDDELLFQAEVGPHSKSNYMVVIDTTSQVPETNVVAYSRFVPERTDDYTWENDKVAFRTYGPEAQRRIEQNEYGGTLSSGIDLWLKKVDYSIIDKWYANNLKSEGYYHIDHGEGHDPYHVGASRGSGGIGIWQNDSLYVSKNFTDYKVIASGPLRTVFELYYAPWSPYDVLETKRITLDLGTNFSKFQITLNTQKEVPNYTIGITLHNNEGELKLNKEQGWFRHWEPMENSYVGEGIVINPNTVLEAKKHISNTPDQSQLLVVNKPVDTLTYYAGFAWTKSNQVTTVNDWDKMLERQRLIVNNPLKLSIEKNK